VLPRTDLASAMLVPSSPLLIVPDDLAKGFASIGELADGLDGLGA
jgi:hypothetical protein